MAHQTITRQFSPAFTFGTMRALVLILGLLALVGIIYLGQSSQATLTGQHVQILQEQKERLRRENAQLAYEIAVLSAPDKIAARAGSGGLHPPLLSQSLFPMVKNYPANVTPSVAVSQPSLAPNDSVIATLWNELLARLGLGSGPRTAQAMSAP